MASKDPSETFDVAVWLVTPRQHVVKESLTQKQIEALASEVRSRIQTDSAAVLPLFWMVGARDTRPNNQAPFIRMVASASTLRAIALHPSVSMILPYVEPSPHSSNYQATVRLPDVLAERPATKIGVYETAQPDNYGVLSVQAIANAGGLSTNHATWTTGILRSSVSQNGGVVPSALTFTANRAVAGGVDPAPWAATTNQISLISRSEGVTCIAQSPSTRSTENMQIDFMAKNAPFPLFVESAGNDGNTVDSFGTPCNRVSNRSMNSLIVGASDDVITLDTMAGFSSFQNMTTSHNDFELPHVVAPGVQITGGGVTLNGTSGATPIMAGGLAYAYAKDALFANWPELGRAVALATSAHSLAGQSRFTNLPLPSDGKQGVGVAHYRYISQMANTNARMDINNSPNSRGRSVKTLDLLNGATDFDANGVSRFKWSIYLAPPMTHVRVASAFDSTASGCSGTGTGCTGDVLDADLDLIVTRASDQAVVCTSSSFDSSWEACEFDGTPGTIFDVTIRKWSNTVPSTFFAIAWNVWIPGNE